MTDRATQPSAQQQLKRVNEKMKAATISGDTDQLVSLRAQKKKLEPLVSKKAEKKEYTAAQKQQLSDLKKQQSEAISLGMTEKAARLQRQMMDIRAENNRQTLGDRALNATAAVLEGSQGQLTNAAGTAVDAARSVVNGVHSADYNRRQIAYLRKALADGRTSDGKTITDAQRKAMQGRIRTMQEEIDRWENPDSLTYKAHHALDKPVESLYSAADQMVDDSTRQQEHAKQNLGAVGSTLVDAAVAAGQSALTGVAGAVTGTGMLPFVAQAFGGSAQEARRSGADLTHQVGYGAAEAAKEYVTEKMFGLTLPQKLMGKAGSGSFDDIVEKGIRNVTDRLAKTPGGQRALGGLASWFASGATEGAEEVIGDAIENVLVNPTLRQWDPDTRTTQEKFDDALYDGLVGALSGMIGGVNQLVGYQPGTAQTAAADPRVQQIMDIMNAQETPAVEEGTAVGAASNSGRSQQEQVDSILKILNGGNRAEFDTMTEEQQNAVNQGYEAGTVGMDAGNRVFQVDPAQHIDQRTTDSVGDKSVNAFQYDHPELHQYYQQAAQALMADAETSLQYPMSRSYERTMQGNRVNQSAETSPALRQAMDETGLSRNQIIDAAQRIVNDSGQDNVKSAKQVELILDQMLSNGYTTMSGETVAPNQAYMDGKARIAGAQEGGTETTTLPIWDMAEASPEEIASNQESVRRAAAVLGENGAKALTNAYDTATAGQVTPEDAVRTFYQVYHSALTGKALSEVDAQRATELPAHLVKAAESSAQQDAARAKQAAYFGEKAGLVKDDSWKKAHLSSKTNRTLDALGKTLGVEIRFADTVEDGRANAQYKDGVITLALDAEDPVLTSVTHEAVHRIRETSPEAYHALVEFLQGNMSEAGMDFNLGIREQLYGTEDVSVLTEETAADAFARMVGNEDFANRFVEDNRNAAQKFVDVLRDIVNSIQRALHHQNLNLSENQKRAFSDLEGKVSEMEQLFTDALNRSAESKSTATVGGETQTANGIRYSAKMSFEDQVDAVLDREMDRNSSVYVMDTPEVLQSLGLKDYPMLMTQRHILDIVHEKSSKNTHWHGLSSDMVKQLPSMIENPVMILESATRSGDAVIITSELDGDGLPVIVSIHPDGSGQYNRAEISSNFITSMYGKDGFEGFISGAVDDGRVLYNNKKRTRTLFANAGLQLPGSLLRDGFLRDTVSQGGGDVKTRFSLKAPVEETDKLIAVHNKDEDSIMAALKLGGLPMPSIAVVKAKTGHSKYGPISLLFNKSTIDPQVDSRNKVYGGDAYTPTNPGVEYPVNSDTALAVESRINELSKKVANGIFSNSSVLRRHGIEEVSTNSPSAAAKVLANDDAVRAAYLEAHGEKLEPVYQDKVWDKYGNDTLQTILNEIGEQRIAEINANFELGQSVETALGDDAERFRDILRKYYRDKGESILQKMAKKRGWTQEEISEKRDARIEKSMENVSHFTLEELARHAWEYYQDGGVTTGEIDRWGTQDKLRELTDNEDVKGWVETQLEGVFGEPGIYNGKDPYTSSGNRRSFAQTHYSYTLENIVKAMQETQEERGGQVSGVTAGGLQASSVPAYRTIQEIRDDSGRLGSVETDSYKAQIGNVEDKIRSVTQRIMQTTKAHSDNSFEEGEIIGTVLMDAAKGKRTIDSIMRTFSREGYKISNVTAKQIQELYKSAAALPTEYFEAKPQRGVGFDEVLAAVIPDNSSDRLKAALQDAGVNTVEYIAGDEADRLAKVNSVDDAQFSRKGKKFLDTYTRENGRIPSGGEPYRRVNTMLSSKVEESAQRPGWNGLGNADAGTLNSAFDDMQAKAEDFHRINQNSAERIMQEQQRAPSDVPKVNPDTERNITKTVSTILNSPLTSPEMASVYENAIADGAFDYDRIGDRDAVKLSQSKISRDGYESVAQGVIARSQLGQHMTKYDMADAISAYNSAVSDGNHELAYELSLAVSGAAHDSAQVVQAMNLMNRLTPEGKLLTLRRYVDSLNDKQAKKSAAKKSGEKRSVDVDTARENYVEQVTGFTISDELATNYLMAETDAERSAAWDAITTSIAQQMPSTFREKADFWRYTSMLMNPTTHVRNIVGNGIQDGARHIKNGVGGFLERAIVRDSVQRTKSVLTGQEGKALKEFARAQYEADQTAAMGAGKYSDASPGGIAREIEDKRTVFTAKMQGRTAKKIADMTPSIIHKAADAAGKGVQKIGDINNKLLDKEDVLFNRGAYVDSFAQALKAKGVTAEEAASGKKKDLVEAARKYAIEEAQRATYRNTTALSEAISGFGHYEGPNPVRKAASFAANALVPFKRTPANILTTGIDYSPIGLTKAISYDAWQVHKGNMSAADMVDHLSSGLTGSGILALGIFLAKEGMLHVRPGGDDDKKEAFEKATGRQDYSLEVFGKSYTVDWAAPAAMALFAGAAIQESTEQGADPLSALADSATGTTNVVLEMSMLSSLNDLISNWSYATNKVTYLVDRTLSSYAGQYFPTVGGKIASTMDDTVRKSYVEKGTGQVASDVDYFRQSVMKKIPGMRDSLEPSIDLWGNEISNGSLMERAAQNFISPGYLKKIDTDPVNEEIRRLAKDSGESGVYPSEAEKSLSVKDENGQTQTINLSASQYTQYAKALGSTRYQALKELFSSSAYQKLSDEDKANAVENVYKMAKKAAKEKITGVESDGWEKKAQEAQEKYGIDPGIYSMLRAQASNVESLKYADKTDKNGDPKTIENSKGYQIMQLVYDSGLTEKQRNAMFEYLGVPKGIRHMNKAAVKEKLQKMKKQAAK